MSAEAEAVAIFRAFDLSDRLRVVMSSPRPVPGGVVSMVCEWHPARPDALTADEGRAYLRAVDEFGGELARVMREARQ